MLPSPSRSFNMLMECEVMLFDLPRLGSSRTVPFAPRPSAAYRRVWTGRGGPTRCSLLVLRGAATEGTALFLTEKRRKSLCFCQSETGDTSWKTAGCLLSGSGLRRGRLSLFLSGCVGWFGSAAGSFLLRRAYCEDVNPATKDKETHVRDLGCRVCSAP